MPQIFTIQSVHNSQPLHGQSLHGQTPKINTHDVKFLEETARKKFINQIGKATKDTHENRNSFDNKTLNFIKKIPEYVIKMFHNIADFFGDLNCFKCANKSEQKKPIRNVDLLVNFMMNSIVSLPNILSEEDAQNLILFNANMMYKIASHKNVTFKHFLSTSLAMSELINKHPDLHFKYDDLFVKGIVKEAFAITINNRTPEQKNHIKENILARHSGRAREIINQLDDDLSKNDKAETWLTNGVKTMGYVISAFEGVALELDNPFSEIQKPSLSNRIFPRLLNKP